MITWINLTNFGVAIGGLTSALLGLILTLSINYIDKQNKDFFVTLFAIVAAYITFDLLAQLQFTFLHNGCWQLSKTFMFFESLLSSMLMPLLTMYILSCTGEDRRKSFAFFTVIGLWLVYFVLLVITQFTDVIYYITPDNVYHRGALYPVLLIPPALLMLTNIIVLIRRYNKLTHRQFSAISVYLAVPLLSMLIQMFSFGLLMILIGTSVSAFIMFIFILIEQTEKYIAQRDENASHKLSIAVLQMRPHFIYNTLTSIYYLCVQDPGKAQQVTADFTSYLQRNFNAIAREGDIPFKEELEHTRAYLAVEKARFEDRLYVTFDTPYENFRIPPLTLQPIVENAVKHGIDPELDPLNILVSTRKNDIGYKVVVEDSGPGFDAEDESKPQIALKYISEKLKYMCGGNLKIESGKIGGTVVTIFIPSNGKNDEG